MCLVTAALGCASVAPASAATTILFDNLGSTDPQTGDSLDNVGSGKLADSFSTSSSAVKLSQITFLLYDHYANVDVSLWSNAPGISPNVELTDLGTIGAPFSATPGDNVPSLFSLSTSAYLQPNTRYWIVLSAEGGDTGWAYGSSPSDVGTTGEYYAAYYNESVEGGPSTYWAGEPDSAQGYMMRVEAAPAPEPAEWAMMLTGLGAIGVVLRRKSVSLS